VPASGRPELTMRVPVGNSDVRRPAIGALIRCAAAGLLLPALFSACAGSSYRSQSETRFSVAPDMSEACSYKWKDGGALFRHYAGWARPGSDGSLTYSSWPRFMEKLRAGCAGVARPDAAEATINGYFLQSYDLPQDVPGRAAIAAPTMVLNAASFGTVPFTVTTFYATCVEILSGGSSRSALSRGRMDETRNAWGRSRETRSNNTLNLTHDLTVQSWHKLWVAGQTLPPGTRCRPALDALYPRADPPSASSSGRQ